MVLASECGIRFRAFCSNERFDPWNVMYDEYCLLVNQKTGRDIYKANRSTSTDEVQADVKMMEGT